jgi:SAM-dependent methyltransferase
MFHVKHTRPISLKSNLDKLHPMENESAVDKGPASTIPVIDYEGSDYRQAFWDGQGREYENLIERSALQQLIPVAGHRLVEVGAGFGRLADLYTGYQQIVLFDYSRTLLSEAVARWGDDDRFLFVAGNLYDLPLATGSFDTVIMLRVMHHLANVPAALAQLERILHCESLAVLEYANKRNLKAIARWLLRRQSWSPFSSDPLEFVLLNFDFHPRWMAERLQNARLATETQLAISHFRLPSLKAKFSPQTLVRFERSFMNLAGRFPLSPSVFVTVRSRQARQRRDISSQALPAALFRCPGCPTDGLRQEAPDLIRCPMCGTSYRRRNQIWDFKEPVCA